MDHGGLPGDLRDLLPGVVTVQIGTVIVLPVPVLFRSFSLLFLRQFGPEWDVWAKIAVPAATTTPPPVQAVMPAAPPPPAQETSPPPSTMPPESTSQPERSPYEPPKSLPPPQA